MCIDIILMWVTVRVLGMVLVWGLEGRKIGHSEPLREIFNIFYTLLGVILLFAATVIYLEQQGRLKAILKHMRLRDEHTTLQEELQEVPSLPGMDLKGSELSQNECTAQVEGGSSSNA